MRDFVTVSVTAVTLMTVSMMTVYIIKVRGSLMTGRVTIV
jgi:hypothetical protein